MIMAVKKNATVSARAKAACTPVLDLPLPAPGRPYFATPNGIELAYLGWGKRFYGSEPLPLLHNGGWTYVVIPTGTPTLHLVGRHVAIQPGHVLLIHPDCLCGVTNRPDGISSELSWRWTEPPPEEIIPLNCGLRIAVADAPTLARLKRIHLECRREVQIVDEATPYALHGLRRQLDAEFIRIFSQFPHSPDHALRFGLACRWLHENLGTRSAIALLGEYLDISPKELIRLFVEQAGCSPNAYLQQKRMRRAEQYVLQGRSVKAAAYDLGYTHPNDLSRAYHRLKGQTLAEFVASHSQGEITAKDNSTR